MSKLDDIIERFRTNTPTQEDLQWALPILTRYRNKSKRTNSEPKPIDFTKTPVLIKQLQDIRLIITSDLIVLQSESRILATKNKDRYFSTKRINESKYKYYAEVADYMEKVRDMKSKNIETKYLEAPICEDPEYNITSLQSKHVELFLKGSKSTVLPLDKFTGALDKVNLLDSVTVSYSDRKASLFWDLNNY